MELKIERDNVWIIMDRDNSLVVNKLGYGHVRLGGLVGSENII